MTRVKVSDGKSVKVIASKAYLDGDFAVEQGFHGFVIGDTASGAPVVLNIEQAEFEFVLPGATVGDIVYADATGALTLDDGIEEDGTGTANRPVLKVTVASDANNVAWGILLPQA